MKRDMPKKVKVKSVLDDSLVNDIPLTEVFVDSVTEPKNISVVVSELNTLCPVSELSHLKRVKAGKVILFPSTNVENGQVHEILKEKGFHVNLLKNNVERIEVPMLPPLVRQQYLKCHSIWPCNFHPVKYLEKLCTNTLFTAEKLGSIRVFMDMAEEISHLSNNSSGVVIVDPKINSVVAVGYDATINGPIRHAVMVAVDNVAKSQMGGAWKTSDELIVHEERNLNLCGIPESFLEKLKQKFSEVSFGATVFIAKSGDPEGPYLCTGYEVYTVQEPCVMCAMALIHSRVKRVFYKNSTVNGALGSLCKIHTVKDLNHHYEVFIVEEENTDSTKT